MTGHDWTKNDVLKLIELLQEREILWNTSLDDYKNKHKKHDAWMDIANVFNLDKHTIEKKTMSLIGQFRRECKRLGAEAYETSKWFAFKKLMFIKDRKRPGLPIDNGSEDNDRNNGGESSGAENTASNSNWTNADVLKLIELLQEREILWNPLSDDYRNKKKKHIAWMDIANVFNLDKHTIIRKTWSLIGQFQRECRKLGAEAYDTSKWFAFKKLMFLKYRNRPGLAIDTGSEDNDINNGGESSAAENTSISNSSSIEKNFTIPKTFRKRNRPEENQDTSVKSLKIMKNMYEPRQNRDHIDAFGEYVTMKLKEMKNSYARNTAQYHINNILYNASIGEYDSTPSSFLEDPLAHEWDVRPKTTYNKNRVPGTSSQIIDTASSFREYISAPSPSTLSESSQDNSTQSLDEKPFNSDEYL